MHALISAYKISLHLWLNSNLIQYLFLPFSFSSLGKLISFLFCCVVFFFFSPQKNPISHLCMTSISLFSNSLKSNFVNLFSDFYGFITVASSSNLSCIFNSLFSFSMFRNRFHAMNFPLSMALTFLRFHHVIFSLLLFFMYLFLNFSF